jgi:hypothetical protein
MFKELNKGFKRIYYAYLAWLWVNFNPSEKSINLLYRVLNLEIDSSDAAFLFKLKDRRYLTLGMAIGELFIPDTVYYWWVETSSNLEHCFYFHEALFLPDTRSLDPDSRTVRLLRDGFFKALNGQMNDIYWESFYIMDEVNSAQRNKF